MTWLTSLEVELRDRLREGCGRFSAWQSVIHGSMKKLRRRGETLTIVMHFQQINVEPRSAEDWNLLHRQTSGSGGSPGRSTCGSESSISTDTGQASQSTTPDYVNSMSMHGGQPPSTTSMSVSPLGTPSVFNFDYAPQFDDQYSEQANDYLAPGNLMTSEYPDSGFGFASYSNSGEIDFQSYFDHQLLYGLSIDQNFGEMPFQESPVLSHNWPPNYTI